MRIATASPRHRGVAMLLVLIAVGMATVLSMSFLASQATTHGVAQNVQSHAQARSVAESALVAAIYYVQTDADVRTDKTHGQWVTNASFNGGTFDLYGYDGIDTDSDGVVDDTDSDLADDSSDPVTLTVIGYFDGVSHTVHAVVTPGTGADAGTVLFVTDNAGNPNSNDEEKADIIEGFGWTVVFISDDASQTEYDTAMADANVVFISEDANTFTLGDKVNNASIGVVSEEDEHDDNLGLASGDGNHYSDDDIDIVDNSHYITQVFSTGDLDLAPSDTYLHYNSTSIASGADVLAERMSSSSAVLIALDVGATNASGGVATSRRVRLPFGGNDTFDIDNVNADALTILERSLLWAGVEVSVSTNIGIAAADTIKVKGSGVIDSFDSSLGAYGGSNIGSSAVISTNLTTANKVTIEAGGVVNGSVLVGSGGDPATVISNAGTITGTMSALDADITLPTLTEPTGMPSSQGDVTISSGTTVYSSDQQFGKFTANSDAIIQISGDVTILANGEFKIDNNAQLQLLPGATLTLYLKDKFKAKSSARVNVNTADPSRFIVNILVNKHFDCEDDSHVYATVIAPLGQLHPTQSAHFYGTFQGNKVEVKDSAQLHQDLAGTSAIESTDGPQLIALYEFQETPPSEPTLVGHWKLDDAAGVAASGAVAGTVKIKGSGMVDSFDSSAGPYGGGNTSSSATLSTNLTSAGAVTVEAGGVVNGSVLVGAGGVPGTVISNAGTITGATEALAADVTIPSISAPSGMPASQGDVTISIGTTVYSSDQQFDKFTANSSAIIQISGNVTFLVNGEFKLDSSAQLQLLPGATLKLYLNEKYKAKSTAQVNVNTADPSRLIIYGLSNKHIDFEGSSHTYATVFAPTGLMHVKQSSHFYGTFLANEVEVKESGQLHQDTGTALYDYASGTQGTDVWAYDGQSSSPPPSNATTPSTQLSAGEYNDIETDDSSRHDYSASSTNNYPMMRYVFEISQAEASVSQIEVTWIGRNTNENNGRTDGVELHIWNYATGSYEQLAVSSDTESEVTLTGAINADMADYIGGGSDDTVTIFAQSRDKKSGGPKDNILYTNYVSLAVSAGGGSASVAVADEVLANDGTGLGGVTAEVAGHGDGGTALEFDGVDDYVEIAHVGDYLLDEGSVSFWFKANNLSGEHMMFSKDSDQFDTGGHLSVYTSGSSLTARLQDTSTSYIVSSSGLSTGTWYHVVVSWGAGGLKLFRDGVERDTDSYTGGLATSSGGVGNYEPIVLGANSWVSDDLSATPLDHYFDGAIDDVRIFDQGFNTTQADNVYNGLDPGQGDATTVYDTSGYGAALDLDIEDVANVSWVPGGGLTLDSATRISSAAAATKLYTELTATDQMSIEVRYTPANTSQDGPASIVSYSGGSSNRNFTVGQESDTYITRLRTDTTTSNGTPDIASGSVLSTGVEEHIIVSYDGENVTMYRNGSADVVTARTGTLNWDDTFRFILGDEITGGREWLGTLHRVAVYNKAFNATQASSVFGGGEPGDGTASGAGSVDWIEP